MSDNGSPEEQSGERGSCAASGLNQCRPGIFELLGNHLRTMIPFTIKSRRNFLIGMQARIVWMIQYSIWCPWSATKTCNGELRTYKA